MGITAPRTNHVLVAMFLVVMALAAAPRAMAHAPYVVAKCNTDNGATWYDSVYSAINATVYFKGFEYNFGGVTITKREWDYGDGTGWHTVSQGEVGTCSYSTPGVKIATYRVTVQGGQTYSDTCSVTVLEVKLLVNDTTAETDDMVVVDPSDDASVARQGAANTTKGGGSGAGPADNYIPLKVQLAPNGVTAIIYLTDAGGGNITIKKVTGQVYEGNEVQVTGGIDLDLRIYGISASSAPDDVTITAKTDKTGNATCGTEDLTVIWTTLSFRGSDHQDEDLDPNNAKKFSDLLPHDPDKLGLQNYHLDASDTEVYNNMEIKVTVAPNAVIPNVTWDIKREVRYRAWGPTGVTLTQNAWLDDDGGDTPDADEDLVQAAGDTNLFVIDAPTFAPSGSSGSKDNVRYYGWKSFKEWVEIKIGSTWFVASNYQYWRSKTHIRNAASAPFPNWSRLSPNEVLAGEISGTPDSWKQPAPIFTAITPNHGSGTLDVSIEGINFEDDTTTKLKRGATEINGTGVSLWDSAELICTFNVTGQPSGSKWDVIITTPTGYPDTVTQQEAFTVD